MTGATKVFYRGKKVDFCLFIDSEHAYHKWLDGDKSVPLSDVLGSYEIYVNTTGTGAEGELEAASKQTLAEEFGSFDSVEDDIIPKILREGKIQKTKTEKKHSGHQEPAYKTVG
ncbi:DEKNAAC102014 [Brettanomyces naardenensis]|uniref:DEKNAAC102014 n=1 Tax=Brettanomyces naardenensis TaxID=13370 RepID=A0A448YJJ1_BRENA|nr:DEKNAAC102014 [Brettanomyces naardenensis]